MAPSLVVLSVLLLLCYANGQSCRSASDPAVQAALSAVPFCAPFLDSQVWLPPSNSSYQPDTFTVGRYWGHVTATTSFCTDAGLRLLCALAFPSCRSLSAGTVTNYPARAQPCSSVCTDFYSQNCTMAAACTTANVTCSRYQPSCSALITDIPETAGQSLFGDTQVQIGGGASQTVQCFTPPFATQSSNTFPCYAPLYISANFTPAGAYCRTDCPLNFQDNSLPDYYSKQNLYLQIICWFGFLTILPLFFLRLSVPKFTKYPANLVFVMLFGWIQVCISGMIQTFVPWKQVVCTSQLTAATVYTSSACGAQGFLLYLGLLLFLFGWTAVCVHSCAVVLVAFNPFNKWTMAISWGITIIVPFVMMIAAISTGNIGAKATFGACVVNADKWQYGVYYSWIMFFTLINVIAIGIVAVQVFRARDPDSTNHITRNLRVLGFLLTALIWGVDAVAYRGWLETGTGLASTRWSQAYAPYSRCSQLMSGCSTDGMFPAVNSFVAIVILYTPSVALPVFFATNKELWTDWSSRKFPWNRSDDGTTGTTAGSSSSASSASDGGTFMSDLQ